MDEMKPGWYSNPETGQTNYWDGSNWTSTPIPMQHQETFRDAQEAKVISVVLGEDEL